jgi:hypothetical protein
MVNKMYISKRASLFRAITGALDFDGISSVLSSMKRSPIDELFSTNPGKLRALFSGGSLVDITDIRNSFNFYKELVERSKVAGRNLTGLDDVEIKIYNNLIEEIDSAKKSGNLDNLKTFINTNHGEINTITRKLETNYNALKSAKPADPDDPADTTLESERLKMQRQKNLADAASNKLNKNKFNMDKLNYSVEIAKNIYSGLKGLVLLSVVGAIGYYFYNSSKEEKEKLNLSIDKIIVCLRDIPLEKGSSLDNLRSSIINRLIKLKLYSSSSQMLTIEQEEEFKKLMIDLFSLESNSSIPSFVTLANNEFASGRISGFNYDDQDFAETIMCINNSSLEAANIMNSIISGASAGSNPGGKQSGNGPQRNDRSNVGGASITGNVTLSTGQSYAIVIDTRKPSMPQRFILYFANGAGPDNFFSSPEFAAFVDPSEESPTGGSGLVPNAIGVNPIEKRIVSAIKYCYNNDIDSGRELSRFMIGQINSGVGRLKKLFTNEPEQRVLSRSIDYYSGRDSQQRRRIFNRKNRNSGNQGI